MNLNNLLNAFADLKCDRVYIKPLAANDNSKNQVYLTRGSSEVLNIFPAKDFSAAVDGIRKRETFIANVDFTWLTDDLTISPAPHAKFIIYPDYPEVRFSGFLLGSKGAPSTIMTGREAGRQFFLAVSEDRKIYGYVASAQSPIAREIQNYQFRETEGIFKVISLEGKRIVTDTKKELLLSLKRIHELGWIDSKRYNKHGNLVDCNAPQCGGYTLEAQFGILPNAKTEPDYLGWELKQFNVKNFEKLNSGVVTLITPEPDGGYYIEAGFNDFMHKYGYADSRIDFRVNFGGVFRNEIMAKKTGLTMIIEGFDRESKKITKPTGGIFLLDSNQNIALSWSFSSILSGWNRKHLQASFIPSKILKEPKRQYHYGNKIMLGRHTDFSFFLDQLSQGNIYYDPAMKIANMDAKPDPKKRSQFRTRTKFLHHLYREFETIDLKNI